MPRPHGQATRDALAAAAASAFARGGYQGATTAAIAAQAGVSEATLFKHFGSKGALLIAALERSREWVEAYFAGLGEQPDLLTEFERRAVGLLLEPRFAEITRIRAFALARTGDPAVVEALGVGRRELRESFARVFRAGQERGTLRADLAPEHIADLVLGLSFLAAWDLTIDPRAAAESIPALVRAIGTVLGPPPQVGQIHG